MAGASTSASSCHYSHRCMDCGGPYPRLSCSRGGQQGGAHPHSPIPPVCNQGCSAGTSNFRPRLLGRRLLPRQTQSHSATFYLLLSAVRQSFATIQLLYVYWTVSYAVIYIIGHTHIGSCGFPHSSLSSSLLTGIALTLFHSMLIPSLHFRPKASPVRA